MACSSMIPAVQLSDSGAAGSADPGAPPLQQKQRADQRHLHRRRTRRGGAQTHPHGEHAVWSKERTVPQPPNLSFLQPK